MTCRPSSLRAFLRTLALWAGVLACLGHGSPAEAAAACPSLAPERLQSWLQAGGGTVTDDAGGLMPMFRPDGTCTPAFEALVARVGATLSAGGAVVLGEVHDNGEHHWLRAALLGALVGQSIRTARVHEHLRLDQQAAIDRAQSAAPPPTGAALLEAIDWASGGWPPGALFLPLFEGPFAHWPLVAGDPSKGLVRDVARRGIDAIPEELRSRHDLDLPLPEALQSGLLDELEASHCGLVPRVAFGGMALAQRTRDAHLAERTATAINTHGSAILLTGNGHVRTDRGVPRYLRARLQGRPILTVMLIEARPGLNVAAERTGQPADMHIITPAATREDPCIAMRAQFGKKG